MSPTAIQQQNYKNTLVNRRKIASAVERLGTLFQDTLLTKPLIYGISVQLDAPFGSRARAGATMIQPLPKGPCSGFGSVVLPANLFQRRFQMRDGALRIAELV